MNDSDKAEFKLLMAEMGECYAIETTALLNPYWRVLAGGMSIETMRGALDAHLVDSDRGRFFPKPADIIAQIEKVTPGGGHVTSDEAWMIALESYDESATVCITPEILQARGIAQPAMDEGDKVAARMAFKAFYERILADPAVGHSPPKWNLSLGWDAAGRAPALERAQQLGRLSGGAHGVIPHLDAEETPLFQGSRKGGGLQLIEKYTEELANENS